MVDITNESVIIILKNSVNNSETSHYFSIIMTSDIKVIQTLRPFLQSVVERLHVANIVWICDGI